MRGHLADYLTAKARHAEARQLMARSAGSRGAWMTTGLMPLPALALPMLGAFGPLAKNGRRSSGS
jgi:hypothetical protein